MGHSPTDVWAYTPSQLSAFLHFATKRRTGEAASALSIGTMAARGEIKDVKKKLKEMEKESN